MIVAVMTTALAGTVKAETYTFSSVPTTGWKTAGGTQTINGVDWTYSSSTFIGYSSPRLQVGSKNNPQTSAWTIQTPVSSFGENKKITAISINAYTTAQTATYDISAGGSSVKSGSLTTSLATYTASDLNVTSGNIVITLQGSSTSKAMYLYDVSVTYTASGGNPTPSISADDVNVAYDTTSGSISYTINNVPTPAGTLTAATTSDWLTLGTVGTTVPFICSANNTTVARTATVTLTYTYGSNQTATKAVTVTQAGNPNAVNNISDITAAGTYTVQGTIVAKSQRGFVVGDGTGYVYYYNQNYTQADYSIGDKVKLAGSVVVYGGVYEFNNTATVTFATESNYVAEDPAIITGAEMDTRVASSDAELSTYVQYEGVLSVSGTYYNITNIDGATTAKGSISFPSSTEFTSLNGKKVKVTGYYVGVSSSQYYNTLIGSVEEIVVPVINANNVELEYDATSGEIEYTITNPTSGVTLSATTSATWITNIAVTADKVTFNTTANEGSERTATITLSYSGATNKVVTITQGEAPSYAELPFSFNGGRDAIVNTDGLTQSGLGTDYNATTTKLKFDTTGDELILAFSERPGVLTFDIKGNSFSRGTFKVQTSVDGTTYTDLATYTELGTSTETKTISNLEANVRFIKWVYTQRSSGNVGLGNISLAQYVVNTLTISNPANVTITATYGNQVLNNGDAESILQGTEVTVALSIAEGYDFESLTIAGAEEGQTVTPTATSTEGVYTFTMPAYDVTVSATVVEHVEPAIASYVLATSITSGKHYVIASESEGTVQVMAEQKTNNRGAYEAFIADDGVLSVPEEYEFVIESTEGGYTIYDENDELGAGYLYASSSSSNYLKTQEENDANGIWSISFNSESAAATVIAQGTNTHKYMRFNSGSSLFSCYVENSTVTGLVYFFEKVETPTPEPYTPETITLNTSGYATFASTSAVDFTSADGYSAWAVTGVNASGVINCVQITGAVAAGTGVLLKGTANAQVTIAYTTSGATLSDNKLVGFTAATEINSEEYFGLSGAKFVKVNGGNVPAGKALLPKSVVYGTGVKTLTFNFDEDATAIKAIDNGQLTTDGVIYNVAGQRLNKMQKGINILNGKKILK